VLEHELVQAQLAGIDAWQAARAERYGAALDGLTDEATRSHAASRLERLARQQQALLDAADALPPLPGRSRSGLRTLLVGHAVTDLLGPGADLDVVGHVLDLDSALGICVAEQPEAVVVGIDLPLLAVAEAVADLAAFCPGTRVCGYGGSPASARMVAETGVVPMARPAGTPAEVLVSVLRDARRAAG
jgi:hypothetical protein